MSVLRRISTTLLGTSATDALAAVRSRWREQRRVDRMHREGCAQARELAGHGLLRLHLGCGNVYKPGWVNIDSYRIPPCRPDLLLDLARPLPFPDAGCSAVYSDHFFEHLPFPKAAAANLRESWRVLAPGGLLSIGVPDPEPVLAAFLAGSHDPYFDYFFHFPGVARHLGTKMEAVNWLFRQGGEHHFIYDFPSLRLMLERAGFVQIARREFDPACDSESRRHGTLYVDARKPA